MTSPERAKRSLTSRDMPEIVAQRATPTRIVANEDRDVLGGQVAYEDGTTVGYTLPRMEIPSAIFIDLRQNIGQMYAGRGWHFQYPPANWNSSFNFVWRLLRGTCSFINRP